MIDSEDHTNAKKDLENYLKKFNIKYEILTSYNWGGTILGLWFFMVAYRFYLKLDDKLARSLMFASFIYLPLLQFLYVFDKL